jgi:hypothetical protein
MKAKPGGDQKSKGPAATRSVSQARVISVRFASKATEVLRWREASLCARN